MSPENYTAAGGILRPPGAWDIGLMTVAINATLVIGGKYGLTVVA